MKSIKEAWEEYARKVLPEDASMIQVRETRSAFYAGYWVMLTAGFEIGGESVTEEQAVKFLEARQQEGEEFFKQVIQRAKAERN